MSYQPSLFDTLNPAHEQAAKEWMSSHPRAMELFERLALDAAGRGRRFGMKFIAERVRWTFVIEQSDDDFKVNNNFVAYVGRELVRRHPHLADFIEFRATRSAA